MIKLFQFEPKLGIPNASPFCMKIETYLKMIDIGYTVNYITNPSKGPKGKLPFIEDDGDIIADSRFIIKYLEAKYKFNLDNTLSDEDVATSIAFIGLMEENLYWVIVYSRWLDERYWLKTKNIFFNEFPPVVKNIIPVLLRKQVKRRLYEQGMGRHTSTEIYDIASDILNSLSNFLGTKKYFMGAKATNIDATAYAFLANIIQANLDTQLKDIALKYVNLIEYCSNMQKIYYDSKSQKINA